MLFRSIWDFESAKDLTTLEGPTSDVCAVAFSPDGKRLATGSSDNTAKIWDLTATSWLGADGREVRLAGLTLPQLSHYGLENLLDQRTGNEDTLIATAAVWQIAAFAELYAQNTRNSQQLARTAQDYARAARLYRAAANASDDPTFTVRLGLLYQNWAKDILASERPDTASRYIELACRLVQDKSQCPKLWLFFSEKTGAMFDFNRFLVSEDVGELRGYGDYFFEKEKWDEARQLYEKAERKQPNQKSSLLDVSSTQNLASSLFNLKKYQDAVFWKLKAVQKMEKHCSVYPADSSKFNLSGQYHNAALFLMYNKQIEEALPLAKKAIDIVPIDDLAHTSYIRALLLNGQSDVAEDYYLKHKNIPIGTKKETLAERLLIQFENLEVAQVVPLNDVRLAKFRKLLLEK